MTVLRQIALGLPRLRRRLVWRSLLALPFALSFVLALILGPATVDGPHASFAWLVAWSLLAALAMVILADGILIVVGLATLIVFPLLAGLGFYFAPTWARPVVALCFYGSIVGSVAAVLTGTLAIVRPLVRGHSRAAAIAAGGVVLLGVASIAATSTGTAPGSVQAASASVAVHNLGPVINTGQREAEPTFSGDARTMIFNCRDYDICVSHLTGSWADGRWSSPQLMSAPISSDYMEVEPWLSQDGHKLYVNSNRPYADTNDSLPGLALYVDVVGLINDELGTTFLGGVGTDEIWVSYLRDGAWSALVNLNDAPGEPHLNGAYADHCLAFSADGNEAFWTSTRPGGYGGNDIWTTRRVNGTWTAPENLGPAVNSAASEHHSLLSPDGRSLQVTSDRAGGRGGEDMYVATRQADGTWGALVDLGSPINGPGNDRCAAWTPNGSIFLFDSDRPGGRGSKDLWWVYTTDLAPAALNGSS
jgi:hypothetical protein